MYQNCTLFVRMLVSNGLAKTRAHILHSIFTKKLMSIDPGNVIIILIDYSLWTGLITTITLLYELAEMLSTGQ